MPHLTARHNQERAQKARTRMSGLACGAGYWEDVADYRRPNQGPRCCLSHQLVSYYRHMGPDFMAVFGFGQSPYRPSCCPHGRPGHEVRVEAVPAHAYLMTGTLNTPPRHRCAEQEPGLETESSARRRNSFLSPWAAPYRFGHHQGIRRLCRCLRHQHCASWCSSGLSAQSGASGNMVTG